MPWVRIDDHFDEHPKIAQLGDGALALFICGLTYSNRNLTDGFIPRQVGYGQLRYCEGNTAPATHELEKAGLWEPVTGGWQIHDFGDYQPSKSDVLAEREKSRTRMSDWRSRHRRDNAARNAERNAGRSNGGSNAGGYTLCDAVTAPVTDPVTTPDVTFCYSVTGGVTNGVSTGAPVPGPGPGPGPGEIPRVLMSSGVWVPDVDTQVQNRASPTEARPDPRRTDRHEKNVWDALTAEFAERLGGERHVQAALQRAEAHGRTTPEACRTWLEEDAARYTAAHTDRASPAARDGRPGDLGRDSGDDWLAGVDARMRERTRARALLLSVP